MKATIPGETDEGIGVDVVDNNGSKHEITIEKESNEIVYHQCENYADDPRERTPEENEYNEQARRFARYYVSQERGYDTVPPIDHPEPINAVRLAIQGLSDERFEALFGDLYRQLRSYHDYDTPRPVPEPPAAPDSDSVLYRQNVYLGIDPLETELADTAENLASEYGLDLSAESVRNRPVTELTGDEIEDWQSFAADLAEEANEQERDLTEGSYIDAVSSVYGVYVDDDGETHVVEPTTDPFEREPDTLIELPPIDPGSLAEFREYLDHHLDCQIRDCFVRMGVEPPEQFRVLGNGRLEATVAYNLLDLYPRYDDPDAG